MAMASDPASHSEFALWLTKKLIDLNTDDEIFSPYILGILETDDSDEEKLEALESILSEIIENDINKLCTEIFKKWTDSLEKIPDEKSVATIDVNEKLANLLASSKVQQVQVVHTASAEQQKLKQAILAQYAEVSDGEESEEDHSAAGSSLVSKNTNAEGVARAEREKRDKDKKEAHEKKEKDKEDRAKQKSKDEERKDKEKKRTQKGERRR